ncbi:MAG: extracellular solute-binding protein [Candidatus Bathyarchaeia archaeon]
MSESEKKKVSRRAYVAGGAAVAAAAVAAGVGGYLYGQSQIPPVTTPPPTTPPVTTPPKTTPPPTTPPFTTLTYLGPVGPEPEVINDVAIPLYGSKHPEILFTYDIAPREYHEEKLMREFTQKEGRYDIVWIWVAWQQKYGPTGGLEDLNKWITPSDAAYDPKVRDPILKGGYAWPKDKPQRLLWPPVYWNTEVLFYRKDLFTDPKEKDDFEAEYGYELKPPETWDEWRDMMKFFYRPPDLYPLHVGTVGWNMGSFFFPLMYGTGAYVIDYDGNVDVTTDAFKKAFEFAVEQTKYCPPGWETQSFFDGEHLFKEGKLAMHMCWEYYWPDLWVEGKTKIYGKGMWCAPPKPAGGRHACALSGGGLTLTTGSKHKRAAADFIQFVDSFECQKAMALTGALGVHPGRLDVALDPDVVAVTHYIKADYWDEFEAVALPELYARAEPEIQDTWAQKVINVAKGTETVDSALADFKKKCEDVLKTL